MNWPAQYAATLAHYRKLYAIEGWKAYALHRVNQMAKADPDLWGMLPAQVMEPAQ
jgi:hypothetical protein